MTTGAQIKEARERAELSQAQLAELAGTSQQTVDRVERGETLHSRAIPRLCEVLKMSKKKRDPRDEIDDLLVLGSATKHFNTDPLMGVLYIGLKDHEYSFIISEETAEEMIQHLTEFLKGRTRNVLHEEN